MKTIRKENPVLLSLIETLGRDKKPIWKRVIKELSRPRRQRVQVNLSKLEAYGNEGGTVLVPGKVLGSGSLSKKLTVAAFSFSDTARKLIADAGGKAVSIESLYKSNPGGRDVLLLK
jgi:large subunit ribosomal protein L18e